MNRGRNPPPPPPGPVELRVVSTPPRESPAIEAVKDVMYRAYEEALNYASLGLPRIGPVTDTQTWQLEELLDPENTEYGVDLFRESFEWANKSNPNCARFYEYVINSFTTADLAASYVLDVVARPLDVIMNQPGTYTDFCEHFGIPDQIIDIAVYGIPPPQFFARHSNANPNGLTRSQVYTMYEAALHAWVYALANPQQTFSRDLAQRFRLANEVDIIICVAIILRILMCKDEDMQRGEEAVFHAGGPEDIPLPPTPEPEGVPPPPPAPVLRVDRTMGMTGVPPDMRMTASVVAQAYEDMLNGPIPTVPHIVLEPIYRDLSDRYRVWVDWMVADISARGGTQAVKHVLSVIGDPDAPRVDYTFDTIVQRPVEALMASPDLTYLDFCMRYNVPDLLVGLMTYGVPPPEYFARESNMYPEGMTRWDVYDMYGRALREHGSRVANYWRYLPDYVLHRFSERQPAVDALLLILVLRVLKCKEEDEERRRTVVVHSMGKFKHRKPRDRYAEEEDPYATPDEEKKEMEEEAQAKPAPVVVAPVPAKPPAPAWGSEWGSPYGATEGESEERTCLQFLGPGPGVRVHRYRRHPAALGQPCQEKVRKVQDL